MRFDRLLPTALLLATVVFEPATAQEEERIEIDSDGWKLVGILNVPEAPRPVPAVVLCHQGLGNKHDYDTLALLLAERGVGSLRLDLRGHGESTNLGQIDRAISVPDSLLVQYLVMSWPDVVQAHRYLGAVEGVDGERIGFVGASYSGELVAIAGREYGFGRAYVILSGMLSQASALFIDVTDVPWWVIWTREGDGPLLAAYMNIFTEMTTEATVTTFDEGAHGTGLLLSHPALETQIADWLAEILQRS
jgi:dienelactone hydrolase